VHGPRQVIDAYLLALAVGRGGRFVTFDRSVVLSAWWTRSDRPPRFPVSCDGRSAYAAAVTVGPARRGRDDPCAGRGAERWTAAGGVRRRRGTGARPGRGARDAVARGRTRARSRPGIKDISRQGRWHNARFKAHTEELGIEVAEDPRIGWSPTSIPPPCVCDCGRRILVAPSVLPVRVDHMWATCTKFAADNYGEDGAGRTATEGAWAPRCAASPPRMGNVTQIWPRASAARSFRRGGQLRSRVCMR